MAATGAIQRGAHQSLLGLVAITLANAFNLGNIGSVLSIYTSSSIKLFKRGIPDLEVRKDTSCPAAWISIVFLDTSIH